MNKKKWIMNGSILILIIITVIYYFNEHYVKQVPIFKKTTFDSVNSNESWNLFRKELKVSNESAKIEDFQLILDQNNRIYSVRFDLVDKNKDKFTVYHYTNCYSCEFKKENQVHISKSIVKEWLQYDRMVDANVFFSALDTLNKKGFFENKKFAYNLIISSGWYGQTQLKVDDYLLRNGNLQKINKPQTLSSNFNIQVIGSKSTDEFSTDKNTTKFVSIEAYME